MMNMRRIITLVAAMAVCVAMYAEVGIVAHRGHWQSPGSAQNSLRSFVKADSVGVYGSEMDVWMTADGKLVVNHDRKFKGVDMECDDYETIRRVVLDNGEMLPDLEEYLTLVGKHPGVHLVLELKSLTDLRREDEAAAKVVDMLRKHGLEGRTDIIAFSINACLAFRKLLPEGVPVYYLEGDLPPESVKRLGLAGLDYHQNVYREHPDWIGRAHDLGLKVNVWTVDDPDDMRRMIDAGVDYITTNKPELLQSIISQER